MTGCSSEGEESVKAGDGLDEAATNNAAPAMAASKPVGTRRGALVSSVFPQANRIQNWVPANLVPNRLRTCNDDLTYVLKQAATTSTVVISCTGRASKGPEYAGPRWRSHWWWRWPRL